MRLFPLLAYASVVLAACDLSHSPALPAIQAVEQAVASVYKDAASQFLPFKPRAYGAERYKFFERYGTGLHALEAANAPQAIQKDTNAARADVLTRLFTWYNATLRGIATNQYFTMAWACNQPTNTGDVARVEENKATCAKYLKTLDAKVKKIEARRQGMAKQSSC